MLDNFIFLNWVPLWQNHWPTYLMQIGVGLCFTVIYFLLFRFLILKFDFKTPGREAEGGETKLYSKAEYKAAKVPRRRAAHPQKTATLTCTHRVRLVSLNCSAAPTTSPP